MGIGAKIEIVGKYYIVDTIETKGRDCTLVAWEVIVVETEVETFGTTSRVASLFFIVGGSRGFSS